MDGVEGRERDHFTRTSPVFGRRRPRAVPPSRPSWTRTGFQATTYAYDKHEKLARMTDPAGVSWTYDARGRVTEANDPDKGVTRTTYDNADRPVTSTDVGGG
ncbi:RHS repeat domain-containing protein [Streptomyces roseicoloratus]|uniref:RHS repeat domain-containing protein n=1 Tax=Streptomyces roseicoloratus TaxID=2508722 RepID=A0ABY9RZZ0_9ACTN|nr:RHS repeat domain-containing protein [Streptomyces roseicoloratus]WMX46754.1 RHS repeat domain-containing protein [Streptomyces roseicoloratus]